MSLTEYESKRDLSKTPEPKGGTPSSDGLRFVVQKHRASHLHYDFRLELDGVLKSWAVPKGPPIEPNTKRLAVSVEDHPLDYRTFEGEIPKGNYGAGTVTIWDHGTYSDTTGNKDLKRLQDSIRKGLKSGELSFRLNGEKLRGDFVLVQMDGPGNGKNWLLIKKKDSQGVKSKVSTKPVNKAPRPDVSASGQNAIHFGELIGTKSSSQPTNLSPMLAKLAEGPFDDPNWLYEIKWDGFRILAYNKAGKVSLKSRGNKDYSNIFKPIAEALEELEFDCIIDGEMVVLDDNGRSDFASLQNYQKTQHGDLRYYCFDLPFANGFDLKDQPLTDRKELLSQLIAPLNRVEFSDHIIGEGSELFEAAKEKHLEGIMAKLGNSKYLAGKRSNYWLKIKTQLRQEVVIGGFTEPKGSRKELGALILGVYDNRKLIYVGHTGGGFNQDQLSELHLRLNKLLQNQSPFASQFRVNAPVTWVRPELVCEVKFAEWTSAGLMRQPVFVGMREDKNPRSVKRELPEPPKELPTRVSETPEHLNITHRDKVFWPAEGYTKGDLIDYYQQISHLILPYLVKRPESLNRHPNGIEGKNFFQKDLLSHPEWIETVALHSESGDKEIHWMICNDIDSLLYMANLGCVEINPWHSRIDSLEHPDYCLIDLDAKTCPFEAVVTVALETKSLLDELSIPSYPKTSGKTGIHICIPLEKNYTYQQSLQFAEILVGIIQKRNPKLTSVVRTPSKRKGKIYLDFMQNRAGQTMAAPYSLRPVPGATVSTPLDWDEVNHKLNPSQFNIRSAPKRFEEVGDLWEPVLGKGISMDEVLEDLLQENEEKNNGTGKRKETEMPQKNWSEKRERQYQHIEESLEQQGRSKQTAEEIAARTVNKERARSGESRSASRTSTKDISSGRRGGLRSHSGPKGRTKEQLYREAQKKNIKGRSTMTKEQLEKALSR